MKHQFTAVIKQDQGWWIGWVKEIPGVNSQGKTRRELKKNLRSALKEALEFNRADAIAAAKPDYEEAETWTLQNIDHLRELRRDDGITVNLSDRCDKDVAQAAAKVKL